MRAGEGSLIDPAAVLQPGSVPDRRFGRVQSIQARSAVGIPQSGQKGLEEGMRVAGR